MAVSETGGEPREKIVLETKWIYYFWEEGRFRSRQTVVVTPRAEMKRKLPRFDCP